MAYITPKEAAEPLKVHRNTIVRLIETAQLEATKVGSQWRIDEKHLQAYLKSRTTKIKK